ncbi:hypothetical protein ES319_A12G025500v1 [Gossypium barbadense]|uniref:AB hydrolase-1 domain-containing protein n=3 Tax=Gossypium TaxID=3633 RepID=A0A2P5WZH8_GOSBA|nr:hypothetical protein ES319_A12G025500v1 [Gossypium barbadense]PPR96487.1 hypothetical protein GOBAR_AA24187 [Gossypium barbadense]TYG88498.1 hypothetical protein ES288_A12G026200v1 [Gossypium darwinii]TYH94230.1 hypothetical protein ES332_A12G027000v1 [Gossypium tomentosum]
MYQIWKLMLLVSLLICHLLSKVPGTSSEPPKHFVLVHGSRHGAWSWYKVVPLLKSGGHNVTALDLGGSGVDPQQVNTLRSISDYIKPLREFMASLPNEEKVVLVGHSLGGLAISQAMEMFPEKISVAVFVTASMPGPILNVSILIQKALRDQDSQMDNHYTYNDGPSSPPTTFTFGPMFLSSKVYQLSPPEDSALASMLMRPKQLYSAEDMSREIVLSQKKYGSVNRVFIISEKDLVSKKDFVGWMIRENPPHEVEVIKGSDHMVMMSKPFQLSNLLLCLAKYYSHSI